MTLGDTLSWYQYPSDNGSIYNIKLYDQIGAASDLEDSSNGKFPAWAWHFRDLRHINGVTSDGLHRSRLVVAGDDDRFQKQTGSWNAYGKTYTVTGAEGERRPTSHMK